MHYEEFAEVMEKHLDWTALTPDQGVGFVQLKDALRDGAGYVFIILDPEGLKITAAMVPGSVGETIRVKKALRTLRHQIYSGRANGPTS